MLSLIEQWKQSNSSQKEFARTHNIKFNTFKYWISKSRQLTKDDSAFIELNNPVGAAVCLRYPNGVELLFPVHTPINIIKGLIQL